ncbi:MAG: hypothetical protein ACRCYO_05370 [Bacteroidia bacterium]
MRYITFFLLLFAAHANAQQTAHFKKLFKSSDHVLVVRVIQTAGMAKQANAPEFGPVRCVVESVYKSKTMHQGDTIAVQGIQNTVDPNADTQQGNALQANNAYVVFLTDDEKRASSYNGKVLPYYMLADNWLGWQYWSPGVDLAIKELVAGKKKRKK